MYPLWSLGQCFDSLTTNGQTGVPFILSSSKPGGTISGAHPRGRAPCATGALRPRLRDVGPKKDADVVKGTPAAGHRAPGKEDCPTEEDARLHTALEMIDRIIEGDFDAQLLPMGTADPLLSKLSVLADELRADRARRESDATELAERAALLELATDAVIVRDFASRKILFWNRGAEVLYGWSRVEALGKTLPDLLRVEFPQPLEELEATLTRDGRWEGELVQYARDGTRLIVKSRWGLRRDALGAPVAFLVSNTDATSEIERRHRREALLRAARRFAAEPDPSRLLGALLDEATTIVKGAGGVVYRWDDESGMLSPIRGTLPGVVDTPAARSGERLAGRSVATREVVIVNDYLYEIGRNTAAARAGVRAAIAAPLLHEGRLLGAIAVGATDPSRRFLPVDGENFELLAGMAAATVAQLEQVRLEGVLLAGRTLQHELNNQLSLTVGYAELLAGNPALPPHLLPTANEALHGALSAADTVSRLMGLTSLPEVTWGGGVHATIDLRRAGAQEPRPTDGTEAAG